MEKNLNYENLNRRYHGVNGELPVSRLPYIDKTSVMLVDAFNEAGIPLGDYNGKHQTTAFVSQVTSQDGRRVSPNNAFIQPIRYTRKNLTVKVKSEVIKILIDDYNKAYGVKYVRNGKVYTVLAKKEVIVSAGVIGSPKLLMLSGVGPKDHLSSLHIPVVQDLNVGKNLQDQVTYHGYVLALSNKTSTLIDPQEMEREIYEEYKKETHDGPLTGVGPINAVVFLKTDPSLVAPDIQIQVENKIVKEFIHEPANFDATQIFPTVFYDGVVPRVKFLATKSRGQILLNHTNPYDNPLIYANYFGDESDFNSLIKGTRFFLSLENTKAFKAAGAHFVRKPLPACRDYKWGTDAYTICTAKAYTAPTHHQGGTCKMGPKWDRKAVVDTRLRVYGVSGLRVMDASIMPFVVRANTMIPVMMIGEKGAAMVIEDWMKKPSHEWNS